VAGREAACDGRRTRPLDLRSLGEAGCGRGEEETTADGIGLAVSVLAPVRASGPTGICETSHRGSAASARARNDPEDRPPRSPEHQSKHGARQAGRMTEVPESECVAVRENRENMPPMIAADGGLSDRVFCLAPPSPRRLPPSPRLRRAGSSGRKSRQGVHAGNRTAGPTLFVQYPGPWEILASWSVAQNGDEKVPAASRPPFSEKWWGLLTQLKNFFQSQHSPTGEPPRE